MGQILKRKKKGRPSKADLAKQQLKSSSSPARLVKNDRRRSLRRRNVRYNNFIDFDDYLDEFEEYEHISQHQVNHNKEDEHDDDEEDDDEEEEEERRKEKKLKLVLKIQNERSARRNHALNSASEEEVEEEEEEEENERRPLKKRKINGGDDSDAAEEDDNENDDDNNNVQEERERVTKAGTTKVQEDNSLPGSPIDDLSELPLPDKKVLELVLDKLQKKDIYGVYAEPVDLEELPDYLEVVEHPMDFATVRKKLVGGSYSTLGQFESDVYLICSNAMQYNSSDTIYHKQARAIQELAIKKLHKVRIDIGRSEKEVKSEQKMKPNLSPKKQMKKPMSKAMPEPVASDFSSGATLANAGDTQNGFVATHASGSDRPSIADGHIEGNSTPIDNNLDKAEDLSSGKGLLPRLGRRSSIPDENRRATYNTSNQPVVRSESIFTTFEGEIKQLVTVGLQAEYSYARSLSRFAAALGPGAWKVASQRIEQALPSGIRFGRGWVGEYEPLPTPVLKVEARMAKEPLFFTKLQGVVDVPKDDLTSRNTVPAKENHITAPTLERKPSLFPPTNGPILEGRPSLFTSVGSRPSAPVPINPSNQKQSLPSRNFVEAQNRTSKQVELNLPPSSYQHDADVVVEKQQVKTSEMVAPKPREVPRTMGLMQSLPSKQPDYKGPVGLPNGKVSSPSNSNMSSSSADNVANQMARAATFLGQGEDRGLNDPVEAMRISAERVHKQQKPPHISSVDNSPGMPSVPSVSKDSNNAAVAAARAWMSVGAGGLPPAESSPSPKGQISTESLYNPTRQLYAQIPRAQGQVPIPAGMQFQVDRNNFPFQAFMRPPVHTGNDGQFPNRPLLFPQFVATDLSRLQMQPSWRGLSLHPQQKQKQETLPPDLNIVFQSPSSPVKQSSGVMVDSQHPDLALQL